MKRAVFDSHCLKRIHQFIPNPRLKAALRTRVANLSPIADVDALDANGIWQLLDCLVYLDLASAPITERAVASVKKMLPALTGRPILPSILSSCYLLGQNDVALQFAPHLREVIASTTTTDDLCKLTKALAASGMSDPDLWQLIGERSIRMIRDFTGPSLFDLTVTLFERKVDYGDFFAVVDRHISESEPEFMTAEMLRQLISWYRRKGISTVNLAASLATRVHVDEQEVGESSGSGDRGGHKLSRGGGGGEFSQDALRGEQVIKAFIANALKTVPTASTAAVLELLQDCGKRHVSSPDVLSAALGRLVELRRHDSSAVKPADAMSALLAMCIVPSRAVEACAKEMIAVCDAATDAVPSDIPLALRIVAKIRRAGHSALLQQSPFGKKLIEALLAGSDEGEGMMMGEKWLLPEDRIDSAAAFKLLLAMSCLGADGVKVLLRYKGALRSHLSTVQLRLAEETAVTLSTIPELYEPVLKPFLASLRQRNWKAVLSPLTVPRWLEVMQRTKIRETSLLLDCVAFTTSAVGAFSASDLCGIMTNAAALGYKDTEWFGKLVKKVMAMEACGISELCALLYMLALVGPTASGLAQEVLPRVRVSIKFARPQDVVFALYGTAALGLSKRQDALQSACERFASTVEIMNMEQILSCLSSIRKLAMSHAGATDAVVAHLTRVLQPPVSLPSPSIQATPLQWVKAIILVVDISSSAPEALILKLLATLQECSSSSSSSSSTGGGLLQQIGPKVGFEALGTLAKLTKCASSSTDVASMVSKHVSKKDCREKLLATFQTWDEMQHGNEVSASAEKVSTTAKPAAAAPAVLTAQTLVETASNFAAVFGVKEPLPPKLTSQIAAQSEFIRSNKPLYESLVAIKKQHVLLSQASVDEEVEGLKESENAAAAGNGDERDGGEGVDTEAVRQLDIMFGKVQPQRTIPLNVPPQAANRTGSSPREEAQGDDDKEAEALAASTTIHSTATAPLSAAPRIVEKTPISQPRPRDRVKVVIEEDDERDVAAQRRRATANSDDRAVAKKTKAKAPAGGEKKMKVKVSAAGKLTPMPPIRKAAAPSKPMKGKNKATTRRA